MKRKRIFIVAPTDAGLAHGDHLHKICWTIETGDLLDIYGQDVYAVLGARLTLAGAKRFALKHDSKRPRVI